MPTDLPPRGRPSRSARSLRAPAILTGLAIGLTLMLVGLAMFGDGASIPRP